MNEGKPPIIRVDFRKDPNGPCALLGIDCDVADYGLLPAYESFDKLPKWLANKVNKLSLLNQPPPPVRVGGVGTRMGRNIYWVEPTLEEAHGYDAGEAS